MKTLSTQHLAFRAMGTQAHIVTTSDDPRVLADVRAEVDRLEALWSRFRPDSEVSHLNRTGRAVVSDDTVVLVEHLVEAWRATGGRFDPTMGQAIASLGYDVPFETGLDDDGPIRPRPGAGCDDVVIDRRRSTVTVPHGVALDPGGLGKGLAADLTAARCAPSGEGLLVNLGGDLKTVGPGPNGGTWRVEVADPAVVAGTIAVVDLPPDAAMATSTPLRRRWRRGRQEIHHLLDPLTGLPLERVARLVTVVTADAWWAEAVTKQIVGLDPRLAEGHLHEAAALVVDAAGRTHLLNGMEEYLA